MFQPIGHKVVLAFMAHPDDAEILCAGTLIRLADEGWEVHIASATAGDCGTMTEPPEIIMAIRREEAVRAAATLGAAYHCLDERDGLVVYDKATIRRSVDLFRRIAPSLVFTHAPKDYMMDHEMVSSLTRAASFLYGAPNISPEPRHPHSSVPYLYYCDPVGGVGPHGEVVTPTTYVDISPQLERKTAMLACHASQRDWLRAHHGVDEYLSSMKRHARHRGFEIHVPAAEAFVQHRGHAYPAYDLLMKLFGE
jgi:LmbE family N-acetylglucosaminyl deacetylase